MKRLHLIILIAIAVPFLAPASALAAESNPFADRSRAPIASSLPQMPYSQLLPLAANGVVKSVELDEVNATDVAGSDEAGEELRDTLDFLLRPERFERVGATMRSGILLYGPPGTGKTLLAKALAGEAGLPFFATSGSDFVELYVGTGPKRVR